VVSRLSTAVRAACAAVLVGGAALSGAARAEGFSAEVSYTSAYGPDAYGVSHLQLARGPDLEVGVMGVGGTQPGLLGTAARTLAVGDRLTVRGEVQAGMLRVHGPTVGFTGGWRLALSPLDVVVSLGGLPGMGARGAAGVDAPLPAGWTLAPRLTVETWAGRRDPALRAAIGVRKQSASGWWLGMEGSAGGRDVLHMGPGAALSFGRSR